MTVPADEAKITAQIVRSDSAAYLAPAVFAAEEAVMETVAR